MRVLGGVLAILLFGCEGPTKDRHALTEHRFTGQGVVGSLKTGQDCSQVGPDACTGGLCLKTKAGFGRGYFCSEECVSESTCPVAWGCLAPLTNAKRVCVPPSSWNGATATARVP